MITQRLCLFSAGLLLAATAVAENITPRLKLNGFATAGAAFLEEDSGGYQYMQNSYGRAGISERLNTKFDSVIGLQLDYQVNDSTNLVTQLVGRGQNQSSANGASAQNTFQVNADWAYIRYAFNDAWFARAGRLGFPGFMLSDSMLIGHAHPWVRPPAEVYANTPVPSLQGFDVNYRHDFGSWTLGSQLFAGSSDTSDSRLALHNTTSLYFTLENDDLTLRAGGMSFKLDNSVSLTPLPNLDTRKYSHFVSAGFSYDNEVWLLNGEWVQQSVEDWPVDFNAGYVTVGHYFGKWLPYTYWATIDTMGEDRKTKGAINTRPASIFEQSTVALGLRFDPKPGLSLKVQVEHIHDIGSYDGIFRYSSAGAPFPGVGGLAGGATLPQIEDTNLYSFTANVAF
ncbi:MAG: hypothetical protein K0R03_283 [Moraxellaceae bacterium]|jgi:hypothetical protein|nr:hypothetical protein [Moraxellaceae bacterium]